MERDILADVNHPFVVKLHYGEVTDPAQMPLVPSMSTLVSSLLPSSSLGLPLTGLAKEPGVEAFVTS